MLRDMIIGTLGVTRYEQMLSRHLYSTCPIEADERSVVTEINTFLLVHNFTNILNALDDAAPVRDIVVDFETVVKPCLTYSSLYTEQAHV
jgi:hypothetical protein